VPGVPPRILRGIGHARIRGSPSTRFGTALHHARLFQPNSTSFELNRITGGTLVVARNMGIENAGTDPNCPSNRHSNSVCRIGILCPGRLRQTADGLQCPDL
jgi:hypothetical protein